ncbi:hypothetical protein ASPZODRAFT_126771 [Penicilliopsis zonata CBS 506.65]|uniref:RNA helicase n=1 Tax=Penicilliopsis zonata CBS 506.65 TaxID=1073090 RepID=A0A1L9SUN4_9EURO|nr:hypothetical protein ASPZODRAFT_126771 [Penicilliopsis zonata CBS 506.65]OJJ50824.1 hypothetical protein ASPZODRAFT_126771 [Penicilliopsis zonata CBS 506.65]
MQLWRSRGTVCLFCAFRPPVSTAQRAFTTSLGLQGARLKHKGKKGREKSPAEKPSQSLGRRTLTPAFPDVVQSALLELQKEVERKDPSMAGWTRFERHVTNACELDASRHRGKWSSLLSTKTQLQQAFMERGQKGVSEALQELYKAEEFTNNYSAPNLEQHRKITDLRYPPEWYPQARSMQRVIHLHVGPTNSGKTYHALKRLEQCRNGFYAGPLRLLAQEVYHRFKDKGVPCSLVTGDEVKLPEEGHSRIVSNTVEMVSFADQYDVGVIDEIQMIADPHRGWAWTRAVLGSRAAELHLCGETRSVPLIRELAALTGDKLEIHRYERLNPLKVAGQSLKGNLNNLQKGDCLVSFSRVGIHALKSDIEKMTGRRAAIVYGGLPAEIRTQQANLFNDPNNDYDFLVASDAIGMGLNLSCKRVIFETLVKRNASGLVRLTVPEIKQIGGRAGRYRAANQSQGSNKAGDDNSNVGWVTALEDVDLPYIRQAMDVEPPPLQAAGILPPDEVYQRFSEYFPRNVPIQYLVKRVMGIARVNSPFFLCEPQNQLMNATILDTVPDLRIEDHLTFLAAPLYVRDPDAREAATAFIRCVSQHAGGRLVDFSELHLEVLEQPVSGLKTYMTELESLHKSLILYLWLSFRFGGVFTDRSLASHVKELVEERMMCALAEFSSSLKLRKDASLRRQIALAKQIHLQKMLLAEDDTDPDEEDEMPLGLDSESNPDISFIEETDRGVSSSSPNA